MPDILQSCLIESANVRLSIVQLEKSWQQVLDHHNYPYRIAEQLGQMLVSSLLLRSNLKQKSSIILQIKGEGLIQTLVAQSTPENTIRGLVKWRDDADFVSGANAVDFYGKAKLIMTLISKENRYQGIIELEDGTISDSLEHYFAQSEQLSTSLQLFANDQRAAGLLIQKLPEIGEDDRENWNRVNILTKTLSQDEMLNLPAVDVIKRLYYQEDVRVYPAQGVAFSCTCSRERIDTVLETMGRDSANEVLEEFGHISVDCEFCNQTYSYNQQQIESLFILHVSDEPVSIN